MKVLLVGSGGREDAIAWALRRSPLLRKLRCAPGNAGTAGRAETVPISADDADALAAHAESERYDLVIVGPEAPLVAGLADRLRASGIPAFGPSAGAAAIEGSKAFAKEFMTRHRIPTAPFRVFSDLADASRFLASSEATYPLVVKADGLAAGKGVVIAADRAEATAAARGMLEEKRFGPAGERVVVEDLLRGREASFFVLTDGERSVPLETCQDYKRALDGDRGPNTGGMGTYSPSVFLDAETRRRILEEIVEPTVSGLAEEGRPYRGVLYVGVMLADDGPRVLEYNARFGDPETQVLIPRLDGDWLPVLAACASGDVRGAGARFLPDPAVCVVMASAGYPGPPAKGARIRGLDEASAMPRVTVFHAGTAREESGALVTAGGRVLGVTALGATLREARDRAYRAVGAIRWQGARHRGDIALDALSRAEGRETG